MVRCTDGTEVEVHASYQFDDHQWNLLPDAERKRILNERAAYKRRRFGNDNNDNSSNVSQITTNTNNNDLQSINNSFNALQQQISSLNTSQLTQNNQEPPASIMGGRNEQASLRSRNNNN